jgi:hypothetical protein
MLLGNRYRHFEDRINIPEGLTLYKIWCWRLNNKKRIVFLVPRGTTDFLQRFRTGFWVYRPSVECVRMISQSITWLRREADRSPSSTEVGHEFAIPPLCHVPSCHVQGKLFCQVVVITLSINLLAYLCSFIFIFHKDCFKCPYNLRNKQLLLN